MKKTSIKKISSKVLACTLCATTLLTQQVYAADLNGESVISSTISNSAYDMYLSEAVETLNIDGINYTYQYHYKDGNRAITVTNDANNNIEEILYDTSSGTLYLNDEVLGIVENESEQLEESEQYGVSAAAYYTWETLSSESHRISWLKGTTTGMVCGAIAAYLGTLGPAGVLAAMGTGAVGVLAASSSGGTLYLKLQSFQAPPAAVQYRYLWSFKASTGDVYGTYISPFSM